MSILSLFLCPFIFVFFHVFFFFSFCLSYSCSLLLFLVFFFFYFIHFIFSWFLLFASFLFLTFPFPSFLLFRLILPSILYTCQNIYNWHFFSSVLHNSEYPRNFNKKNQSLVASRESQNCSYFFAVAECYKPPPPLWNILPIFPVKSKNWIVCCDDVDKSEADWKPLIQPNFVVNDTWVEVKAYAEM